MAVVRCEKGHYFDNEKYGECPHCQNELPQNPRRGFADEKTVFGAALPGADPAALKQRVQVEMGAMPQSAAGEKTVGIFKAEKGFDPVVGWLVCVAGSEKGRDFRLHAGRNFVGRALKSDIALVDDERISREDHCSIVFEPRQSVFLLARGSGDGVTVNGERLADSRQLIGEETIELGSSAFVFIPFCRGGRGW